MVEGDIPSIRFHASLRQGVLHKSATMKMMTDDEQFPPDESSLIKDWEADSVVDKVGTWCNFEWRKSCDIPSLGPEAQVFFGGIEPSDIKQGQLGDCYFLSVLSLLAEKENRVKNLFAMHERTEDGFYTVNMLKTGEWQSVVVDDLFPCDGDEPAFSRANGRELWVLLLEKAWAKKYGSYARIEAGFAENVMHDLTGAPAITVETSEENLWDELVFADASNHIIGASAGSSEESERALKSMGLVAAHAYGLLKVVEFEDQDGNEVRLV